jgi:lysophospholipase L1-like esterase
VATVRYVAIGDSFTEGVGDDLPDGRVRGWADLVAQGWADATAAPIEYANLAIRGKLAWPIVQEQLEPALALRPTHLSFNGGGNDMIRPRTSIAHVVDAFSRVIERCDEEGVRLILLSGANPSAQLPLSRLIQRRGDLLSHAVSARIADRADIVREFNLPDLELSSPAYLSEDRLHMH